MSLTSPENKMSKSDKDPNGCVYLMEDPAAILLSLRAVTDSETRVPLRPKEKPGIRKPDADYASATGKRLQAIRAGVRMAGAGGTLGLPWARHDGGTVPSHPGGG